MGKRESRDMGDRQSLMVRLTPEARSQLVAFCIEHGVTATGLVEAFARMIDTATPERKEELVRYARQYDGANRARS